MNTANRLAGIRTTYDHDIQAAANKRDTAIAREVDTAGTTQADIARHTGYTRQHVRTLLRNGRELLASDHPNQ